MIDKWVFETFCNSSGKIFELCFWKVQSRDDLIINSFVHKSTDYIVVHAVSYNILSCKVSTKNETCMSTVQDTNFSLLVWAHIWYYKYFIFQSCFFEWKYIIQLWISFDYPYTEYFSYIQQRVSITMLLFQLCYFFFITDTSWYDTVNQRSAESAFFIYVFLESIFQSPLINVLIYTFQQFFSVVVDQLTA